MWRSFSHKANCPKLKIKNENEHKHQKWNKKHYFKGKRGKVAKRVARSFMAALSDIDGTSSKEPRSKEEEPLKKEKKTMDLTTFASWSTATIAATSSTLLRLLKLAAKERKELKLRLHTISTELAILKSKSDDAECESCLIVMNELAQLHFTHAQTVEKFELTEKKLLVVESSLAVINECMNCPLLVESINLRDRHVDELKARLESVECSKDVQPACPTCITLKDQLIFAREQVKKLKCENDYLLSMVEKCTQWKELNVDVYTTFVVDDLNVPILRFLFTVVCAI
ncbi:hypothetical protein GUJ93_ZPchr0001g32435 [Zizania palustris]|uniref:Uncharacterized protein n=1 Tax=Zizania palustris TaxID=103762 RepID=A0A8J5SB56_ZIZPA|nr:hypothetical protein GUJ93_ZPchr0001g32435 [Zizania palustris]